eukprot:TRINITY_DN8284_c0_g1_i1.p1 TRINITY_DN8284_c0_g1~~TRINITY_DN8284_c0_g1_i1.p1  ORF type:complete len:112 (+),score=15.11 TRINITY_DN8284_c0_g1_i1:68-403(+)
MGRLTKDDTVLVFVLGSVGMTVVVLILLVVVVRRSYWKRVMNRRINKGVVSVDYAEEIVNEDLLPAVGRKLSAVSVGGSPKNTSSPVPLPSPHSSALFRQSTEPVDFDSTT